MPNPDTPVAVTMLYGDGRTVTVDVAHQTLGLKMEGVVWGGLVETMRAVGEVTLTGVTDLSEAEAGLAYSTTTTSAQARAGSCKIVDGHVVCS